MNDEWALVKLDVGELAKPATLLIEKIAEAIGGIFRPYQIRRVAEAEAQAEKTQAVSRIETTELQQRALRRFLREEAKKQRNIESITQKALSGLQETSRPGEMHDDWIINFFDKCRLVSDEQMQALWSKVLAGEANSPGRYSRRTVNLLASLERPDAELFKNLCSFCLSREGGDSEGPDPFIYAIEHPIYNDVGIDFDSLTHLDDIGLISFDPYNGFGIMRLPQQIVLRYFESSLQIELKHPKDNRMHIGTTLLSKPGVQLAQICHSTPRAGFTDYLTGVWSSMAYKVSEINKEE